MHPTLTAAAVAAGGLALGLGPMAWRYGAQRRLARTCAGRRALVLSYDDGPGAEATPRILDALAASRARASFFALGQRAAAHPAVLDRAVREGHEIGTHSYRHLHPWKSAPWASARDASEGFRALERWTGRDALFRPPHGKLTVLTWAVALARRSDLAWWTLDSGDTWVTPPSPAEVTERVRRAGGGVVLMHDFDRAEDRVKLVVDLTESLLRAAREDGFEVLPLGEVLRAGPSGR